MYEFFFKKCSWLAKHLNEGTDPGFWGEFKFYSLGVMAYIGGGKAAIFHENKAWCDTKFTKNQF